MLCSFTRLIVVAEKEIVYSKFPIPLINRLEKHFLNISTMLSEVQVRLAQKLEKWAEQFIKTSIPTYKRFFFSNLSFMLKYCLKKLNNILILWLYSVYGTFNKTLCEFQPICLKLCWSDTFLIFESLELNIKFQLNLTQFILCWKQILIVPRKIHFLFKQR